MADEPIAFPGAEPDAGLQAGDRSGLSRLRILATSDLHAHVMPWDYHRDRASAATGLARTASLIAQARAEVDCSILVDNGDFLQGGPLGDSEALAGRVSDLHPMIAAMNALGYDAVTLGNHEFSQGLDFLLHHLRQAAFPVISANLVRRLGAKPFDDAMLVPPTVMITRALKDAAGEAHPLRIGVIGLAPPQTLQWDHGKLGSSLQARDIVEAALAHVPRLRAAGADVVLALSHSGIAGSTPLPGMENATAALARLARVDALVAGHTHQTFPASDFPRLQGADPVAGTLWGKPVVMPGFYGSHLGVIDLMLGREAGRWVVRGATSRLRPIARRAASGQLRAVARTAPDVAGLTAQAHAATRVWTGQPVGQIAQPLHSYFAMVAASPVVRLIARAQAAHVTRALRGLPLAQVPVLSAAAPFHAGGRGGPQNYTSVAAGPLSMRHIFDLYPHPNAIAALRVTGQDMRDWLERAFSQFHQIPAGAVAAELLDPDFPSFNFDQIEGLTWSVDLSSPARYDTQGNLIRPAARRIVDLRHLGRPVGAGDPFILATNSYRATGSGGFSAARLDSLVLDGPEASRDILRRHISEGDTGAAGLASEPNWRFLPMPGTAVLFDSAPAAASHLADLAPLRAEALALTPQGFRRFRLHL